MGGKKEIVMMLNNSAVSVSYGNELMHDCGKDHQTCTMQIANFSSKIGINFGTQWSKRIGI